MRLQTSARQRGVRPPDNKEIGADKEREVAHSHAASTGNVDLVMEKVLGTGLEASLFVASDVSASYDVVKRQRSLKRVCSDAFGQNSDDDAWLAMLSSPIAVRNGRASTPQDVCRSPSSVVCLFNTKKLHH